MKKERLDKVLVEQGIAPSRQRAQALIMAGKVLVEEQPIVKSGALVSLDADIRLRQQDHPYVSRGGVKLAGALDDLKVDVEGLTILDVGASTGGFTDVCLQRGAAEVYAVDVGTNQLDYRLRSDPRVTSLEQTNARYLTVDQLPGPADLAVIDVSFISITKLLEAVSKCLRPDGRVVAMVKPQFEVGKEKVGKGGVVKDEALRQEAVQNVVDFAADLGFDCEGRAESRLLGPKGNKEIFVLLKLCAPAEE